MRRVPLPIAAFVAICGCRYQDSPRAQRQEIAPSAPSAATGAPPVVSPKLHGTHSAPAAGGHAQGDHKSVLLDTGGQSDNSSCLVCHADMEDEAIAAGHLKADIVCAACHGDSEAHRGDELNIIKPDALFGRAEIAPFCKSCHGTHKKGEIYDGFLKEWKGKRRPNGRMVLEDSVCTDCHGNHAILRPEQQTSP